MIEPYYSRDGIEIYCGDALKVLKAFPDELVNCCMTSPPYYGLRDYGINGQIGLEETPEEYVEKLVTIFNEVKRVLKKDGTVWLVLGDSYAHSGGTGWTGLESKNWKQKSQPRHINNLKPKDLIGIPWMAALALRKNNWYLRQDIIWSKPNPMPESIKDRCTKSHEYIFLLTKSAKYYYDQEAIKEDALNPDNERTSKTDRKRFPTDKINGIRNRKDSYYEKRNKRSVWEISTQPYPEAHFAVFPEKIPGLCIKAGCPKNGTVLDPFGGSGTVADVAHRLGRKAISIELKPEYCDLHLKRWTNYELGL